MPRLLAGLRPRFAKARMCLQSPIAPHALYHGSGRSTPSRVASSSRRAGRVRGGLFPLTARLDGRSPGERLAERTREVDLISTHTIKRMPNCAYCGHRGDEHYWIAPPCSLCRGTNRNCQNCQHQAEIRRKRGVCLRLSCPCRKYVPDVRYRKPLNSFIGRGRYKSKYK
jgi:hypothetical protein